MREGAVLSDVGYPGFGTQICRGYILRRQQAVGIMGGRIFTRFQRRSDESIHPFLTETSKRYCFLFIFKFSIFFNEIAFSCHLSWSHTVHSRTFLCIKYTQSFLTCSKATWTQQDTSFSYQSSYQT